MAKLLTRGIRERDERTADLKYIINDEVVRLRAQRMHKVLTVESVKLWDSIAKSTHKVNSYITDFDSMLVAMDEEGSLFQHSQGLNFDYAWLDYVIDTILTEKTLVEVEAIGPYAAVHFDHETDSLRFDAANLPASEKAGLMISSLMRKIARTVSGMRIISLLDDFSTFAGRALSSIERDEYVVAIAHLYGRSGVIMPDDHPGRDFILLRESELANRFALLVEKLSQSGRGRLVTESNGKVCFFPNEELIDSLSLRSNSRKKEFGKRGILLKRSNGFPTCAAMDASGFLDSINKLLVHVVMLDKSMESQQDKTYLLLRAMNITSAEKYHNIFFDAEKLSPEMITYGICQALKQHVEKFMAAL